MMTTGQPTENSLGLLVCAAVLASAVGCGSDDDDDAEPAGGTVDGDYTISVTNRENGCGIDGWTEDNSSSGIRLLVATDDGEAVGAVSGGGAMLLLGLGLGLDGIGDDGYVFEGNARGGSLTLTRYGTASFNEGNCTYTFTATIDASVDGDVIQGEIRYIAATNDNPDCAGREGCVTRQNFNGTRPPS